MVPALHAAMIFTAALICTYTVRANVVIREGAGATLEAADLGLTRDTENGVDPAAEDGVILLPRVIGNHYTPLPNEHQHQTWHRDVSRVRASCLHARPAASQSGGPF